MKKLILPFLFVLPLVSYCQRDEIYANAFLKSQPPELGQSIHLPDPGLGAAFSIEDIAPYDAKQRMLVITSDSLYKKIFSLYEFTKDSLTAYVGDRKDFRFTWMVSHLRDSIPFIDFSKKELVLYSACAQCMAYCNHKENNACHRNVCVFTSAWFIRDKVSADEKRNYMPLGR